MEYIGLAVVLLLAFVGGLGAGALIEESHWKHGKRKIDGAGKVWFLVGDDEWRPTGR